ncbi:MAG: plasmid transfer operon protein [Candidatus Woesearchaeota archaeon]|nr:plasmid transfer operon protein [Candidatus Woesearchaeota archaeon]MDN5327738.1 plasmid transfer operon protein [Candidatus Woesearchaeota archaeon]
MGRAKIVRRRYFAALLITISIFILGLFFGFLMDNLRTDYFTQFAQKQELDYRSLQLQYELMNSNVLSNQCQGLRTLFDKYIKDLEDNRERLEVYNQKAKINKEEFALLKRRYTLSQINFWYISQNLRQTCPNSSDYVTILYFYGTDEQCPSCDEQASYLDYFKKKMGTQLLIFALDSNFEEEPTISVLKDSFDVDTLPTLVVNGKKFGFLDKEQLADKICEHLRDKEKYGFCKD